MGVLGGFSRSSDQELAILELWVLSFGCCRVAGPATFNGIGAENQRNHIKGPHDFRRKWLRESKTSKTLDLPN